MGTKRLNNLVRIDQAGYKATGYETPLLQKDW